MSLVSTAIVSCVCDVLEAAGLSPVYERRMEAVDGSEGIVVRPGTQVTTTEYIDGRCEVSQAVRMLVKRRSAVKAMRDAEAAWDAVSGIVMDVSGTSVEMVPGSVPYELTFDDGSYSVWETTATARYTTPKE